MVIEPYNSLLKLLRPGIEPYQLEGIYVGSSLGLFDKCLRAEKAGLIAFKLPDLPSDFFSEDNIDLMALCHLSPESAHSLVTNPLAHEPLLRSKRLCNIPDCFSRETINATEYNRLVKIKGTIIRVGPIVYKNITSLFSCVVCKAENEKSHRCLECGSSRLLKKLQTKDVVCSQTIKIQDISKGSSTVEAVFEDKKLGRIIPGDQVIVTGIVALQLINTYLKENEPLRYGYIIRGLNLEVLKNSRKFDESVLSNFLESNNKKKYLIDIFCKQIFGLSDIKLGLVLCLAGSINHSFRSNAHCLLVGDSSMGKTVLLKYVSKIVSPSRYINGLTTSEVGLTACAIKQDKDWALEAGALVVTHGGACCLDNFDSLGNSQKAGLLEAMEQQTISIAKAGMCVRLNARSSIIAASSYLKSKKGRKNGQKGTPEKSFAELNSKNKCSQQPCEPTHINSNSGSDSKRSGFPSSNSHFNLKTSLNISTPLLSRFDLIFGIFKDNDTQKLSYIADTILNTPQTHESDDELRCILGKIKTHEVNPNHQFKHFFIAYYRLLVKQKDLGEINTIRVVESLNRLAINTAKIDFRDKVEIDDVMTAILLFESSLRGINIVRFDREKIFNDRDYFNEKKIKLIEILNQVK